MRVALINPKGYLDSNRWMPLGLLRLATVLSSNHDVKLLDEEVFNVEADEIDGADVVCVSGMSHQQEGMKKWARLACEKEKQLIVGGIHTTLTDESFAGAAIVKGPGDEILPRLLDSLPVEGVFEARWPANLDSIPFPDRKKFGWERYGEKFQNRPAIRVLGAVGCPFACKFCCNRSLSGGKLILREPEAIAAEIESSRRDLGFEVVVFAMSVFSVKKSWAERMCGLLKDLGVNWVGTTRVDLVDRELLELFKSSGCIHLGFGVESGSDEILRIMQKGTTKAQARQAFSWAREVGLPTLAMFMTHVPGETLETLRETLEFAKELAPPLGCTFQRFSPLPGSEFYDELDKWGKVIERRGDRGEFGPIGFIANAFIGIEK